VVSSRCFTPFDHIKNDNVQGYVFLG